jgi:hypothetical protein
VVITGKPVMINQYIRQTIHDLDRPELENSLNPVTSNITNHSWKGFIEERNRYKPVPACSMDVSLFAPDF